MPLLEHLERLLSPFEKHTGSVSDWLRLASATLSASVRLCMVEFKVHTVSVVEPEPPGAALFGRSRSREERGGSGSSSRSSYDPMFEEKIEQKC